MHPQNFGSEKIVCTYPLIRVRGCDISHLLTGSPRHIQYLCLTWLLNIYVMVLSQLSKIEINRRGFIDPQRQGVVVGEEEILLFFFLALRARFAQRACSLMFSKRTRRKIKQRLCTGYIFTGFYWGFLLAGSCFRRNAAFFHLPMIPPVSLGNSLLEGPTECLKGLLPSPCTAFSQSPSIDSFWWRIWGEHFRLDQVTALVARNNGA